MALIFEETDPILWTKLKSYDISQSAFVTPTDTVLGLGILLGEQQGQQKLAKQKLADLKQRTDERFIILIPTLESAYSLCRISIEQERCLLKYWPGKITFILSAKDSKQSLAVRFPEDSFLLKWMAFLGGAILSSSCNVTGQTPVTSIHDAVRLFGEKVGFYVAGKNRDVTASTLVDLTCEPPKVLRQGNFRFST